MRGTQTFMGVMGAVWRRPSLTGLEIVWRWSFGALLLALGWWRLGAEWTRSWRENPFTFQLWLHGGFIFGVNVKLLGRSLAVLVLLVVVWACVWSAGRLVILRRLDGRLRGRWSALAQLAVLRVMSFAAMLGVLGWVVFKIAKITVFRPMAALEEPAYVLGFAGVLGVSLALFVVWSLVSWVLQLAPVLAMAHSLGAVQSIREALKEGPLRMKLMEINLVMNIVKLALIVLAMVFSASPLPFSSVASQGFLTCWWLGVGALYLAMSDYFQVVRAAAYLSLWRTYHPESGG